MNDSCRVEVPDLLRRAGSLVRDTRDIVEGRVQDDMVPGWIQARGWEGFLLSLGDAAVGACESQGLAYCVDRMDGAPSDLSSLALRVRSLVDAIPVLERGPCLAPVRRASPRKTSQLAQLLHAAAPLLARSKRVVDVGSGRGTLAMTIAALCGKTVLGVELVEDRVRGAARRGAAHDVSFVQRDALLGGLGLEHGDLAVGLHACGQLGDALILEAIGAKADVALVTCCVQKIRQQERAPVSALGACEGLTLRREVLGLANLTARDQGVEVSVAETMRAREARCALRIVLRSRGLDLRSGDEMSGINRRKAHRGARDLIAAALAARGMQDASPLECQQAEERAVTCFGRARRLTLPRAMLGPIVELAVVLDRACALVEADYHVRVGRLFEPEASPRNLVVLGRA